MDLSPQDALVQSPEFKMIKVPDDIDASRRVFPELTEEYVAAVKKLWKSPQFKDIWANRSKLQVIESTQIFLDRIDEVTDFGYKPNKDDIILSRARTAGIYEERLTIESQVYE